MVFSLLTKREEEIESLPVAAYTSSDVGSASLLLADILRDRGEGANKSRQSVPNACE
jgi:hypothetical protein